MTEHADKQAETEAQSPDPYAPDAAAEPDPPGEHVTDDGSGEAADHFEQQDHHRF